MSKAIEFSQELFNEICDKIAVSNNGLVKILGSDERYPSHPIFYSWIKINEENISRYACAREAQADFLVDEILEISDDTSQDTITISNGEYDKEVENREWINRSKLKVDSRKWIASKFRPTKYGDKLDIDHKTNGKDLPAAQPLIVYTTVSPLSNNESDVSLDKDV